MSAPSKFETIRENCKKLPHGTRARYVSGCKCLRCRAANSNYNVARERAKRDGGWNGIVDAAPAAAHLKIIGRQGIGLRAASAASDISRSILQSVKSGRRLRIRRNTLDRILAIDRDCRSGGTLVSASPALKLIEKLVDRGYTRADIARMAGYKTPALQFPSELITAQRSSRFERLYKLIDAGTVARS